ncbi:MAG: tRNA (guanosine(37)-N1)-methyltransferase TrmD [Candidatus Moranbacteria bacterium]|nr:tRNA (guanosine(37)-N1)-methyltransferase TrmD [Candidatus Moranbacteria bacterium]
MRFDIISLFPESLTPYLGASILGRAEEQGLIEVVTHQLRDFAHDKHKTVDDTPYGGGAGMVLKVEPIAEALEAVKKQQSENGEMKTRTILFSAKGKVLTQEEVRRLATYDRLILLCGRYEGVDERVAEHLVDEELSIGEYVLTGGEIPALVVVDAVSRLIPGVLGNSESAQTESHTVVGAREHPQYTKPEEWRGMRVPQVLLSGHHGEIAKWRAETSLSSTPEIPDDLSK